MRIILSTYNFYPVHKGGTEVYTKALAVYLRDIGNDVLIISALDEVNEVNGEIVVDNVEIKAVYYSYECLAVLGIRLKKQTVDDVYAGFLEAWTENFAQILVKLKWQDATHLIMNGITTVSGLSLCHAATRLNISIKVSVIVHTPFICPKADMIFYPSQKRCEQVLTERTCASCLIAANTGIPFSISHLFTKLINNTPIHRFMRSTVFRLEDLLKMKFRSFDLLNERVTNWIVFSSDMAQFLLKQLFITPGKISVIRHGIDSSIFFDSGVKREIAPTRFLYAGRFEEVKGVSLLSEAWMNMEERPEKKHLYLTGNWKETNTGRKVADLLEKRSDVTFMDALEQTALAALYRKTHCVIIPSKWIETGPLVFHEAIACGCNVITSDIGGQAELANFYKKRSFLFTSGNIRSLQKAIENYFPSTNENENSPINLREHFDKVSKVLKIQ